MAGKYRLLRVLATGGMGRVWVARNEATGAEVALKVLRRGDAEVDQEARLEERFRQEARLSAMVAHRSIVRVFDLVEEEGALVLVMELLRGETLHAYVQRLGARPADEAVAIVTPVLGALAHAHDCGLVHRDVSPANVFLAVEPDGHVAPKLVDFGIAKTRDGASSGSAVQTVTGDVLGTPRYVAPERIRGQDVDGRADLFSAGVVLYEVLTGVSPFAASTASASLAAVLERTIDPDPSIDPRLWLELRRALAKQPYERHATARELAMALRDAIGASDAELEAKLQTVIPVVPRDAEEVASGVAVLPSTPTPGGSGGRPSSRARSVAVWLVSGFALAAVLVGALTLMRSSRPAASRGVATPVCPGQRGPSTCSAASSGDVDGRRADRLDSDGRARARTLDPSPQTGQAPPSGDDARLLGDGRQSTLPRRNSPAACGLTDGATTSADGLAPGLASHIHTPTPIAAAAPAARPMPSGPSTCAASCAEFTSLVLETGHDREPDAVVAQSPSSVDRLEARNTNETTEPTASTPPTPKAIQVPVGTPEEGEGAGVGDAGGADAGTGAGGAGAEGSTGCNVTVRVTRPPAES